MSDLGGRLSGLRDAVAALDAVGSDYLGPSEPLERARAVLERVGRRRELSTEHTVVALAGTTGSGKSSLLNALAGADVATVGVRRPTTAYPLALLWGPADDAGPLLDWLEVAERHERAARWSGADVDGLVLLDLPDVDSVNIEHRRRAARLAETVDVLVWVLDPQKYADAVVHADFLRPMARHAEVTVVVLNQVDRLAEADRGPVLADLKARLVEDGLGGAQVLAASARTGEGVEKVRSVIARFVTERRAADARLSADVATVADDLDATYHAEPAGKLGAGQGKHLVAALGRAAGVDRVADAVAVSFRRRARASTGWPVTRWLGRFRPDPLRRLHLDRAPEPSDGPVVAASSIPDATPVQRAQVHTALRELGDAAAQGSTEPWRSYIRAGATSQAEALPDALDQAIVRTKIDGRTNPAWFRAVGLWQWLALAVAIAGALWLGVYAVLGYMRIEASWVPQLGPVPANPPLPELPAIPWPTALLVVGVVVGLVTALVSGLAARVGARRRSRRTRAALRASLTQVAREQVLAPVQARVAQAQAFADGVKRARAA